MHRAWVNKILPFSLVDGPGCRCAVFLQGCNIRCVYCHNPETQSLCDHCGICVSQCPSSALTMADNRVLWDQTSCTSCDHCLTVCPNRSSPKALRMDAAQVYEVIRKSLPFIRGVTVSGGECMLYPEFLKDLFTLCRRDHLSCLIDSNGTMPFSKELLKLCDGIMLDVKAWDAGYYQALTGGENTQVIENLKMLSGLKKLEEIRIVCLPGHVDAENAIPGIAQAIGPKSCASTRLKLIRFRPNGVKGPLSTHPATDSTILKHLHSQAQKAGFTNIQII